MNALAALLALATVCLTALVVFELSPGSDAISDPAMPPSLSASAPPTPQDNYN